MTWRAVTGGELEWPTRLHAWLARCSHGDPVDWDAVMEVLHRAKKIHEEALKLDAKCRDLMNDNMRLKHENEFMLRLINEKENKINEMG